MVSAMDQRSSKKCTIKLLAQETGSPPIHSAVSAMNASKSGQIDMRVLSLDGDGVRVLSSLLVLRDLTFALRKDLNSVDLPRPCEYFDLICGTSTGGLTAILLERLCFDAISWFARVSLTRGRVIAWYD